MMNKTMQAAVFEGIGNLVVKEVPVPRLERDDQVLLKVEAVSICGTDVHITSVPPAFTATPNIILGHEFVGTVVEKGSDVIHLEIGDHVVVNPNDYCGVCVYCRKHLPNQCENLQGLGIQFNGAFAEYCRVSGKVSYKISKSVPVEVAAIAEPLACVINGTQKARLQPGETAVVIGCGPIGLIMGMLLKSSGASKVILADKAPFRLEVACKLGIGTVVDVSKESLVDVVRSETLIGADLVADMVGSQLPLAIEVARKDGKVIAFGINMVAKAEFLQLTLTNKELQVYGSWLANATFPEAVRVLETGLLDISALITETIPLKDVVQGVAKLARGEAVKIIVKP